MYNHWSDVRGLNGAHGTQQQVCWSWGPHCALPSLVPSEEPSPVYLSSPHFQPWSVPSSWWQWTSCGPCLIGDWGTRLEGDGYALEFQGFYLLFWMPHQRFMASPLTSTRVPKLGQGLFCIATGHNLCWQAGTFKCRQDEKYKFLYIKNTQWATYEVSRAHCSVTGGCSLSGELL